MANVTKPILLDETGQDMVTALETLATKVSAVTAGDYSDLSNKPQINGVTLSGNKSLSDLGIPVSVITPESGTTFTLQPCPVTYSFGEKAELTVTVTATSQYHFMFSCPVGSATALTINGETYRMGDTIEAGETYEVDVWAGVTRISKLDGSAVT